MYPLFYFNDCLPKDSVVAFAESLDRLVRAFDTLRQKQDFNRLQLVTERLPNDLYFQNSFSLAEVIDSLEVKAVKTLAHRIFSIYPIQKHFVASSEDENQLYSCDYKLKIGVDNYDALNLALVQSQEGYLASLPLHEDLKQNHLKLFSEIESCEVKSLSVCNLYGDENNMLFIENQLFKLKQLHFSRWQKLLNLFDEVHYSPDFEREFKDLSSEHQTVVIEHFERAKMRSTAPAFSSDGKLIKQTQTTRCVIYELRIQSPVALRVYFNGTPNKCYLAKIGNKDTQQNDIKKAVVNVLQLRS